MNTNKIVHNKQHQQSTILTNSPPTHPSNPHHHHHQQQHYQEMIKTSFPPSVTPHSYVDISPPSASSTLHASGMHLPSLSHHYDTSSVPSSLDMTTTTNNTRRSMTTPLDYNSNSYHQDSMQSHHHVKREIHEQVHVNNHHFHQHRYHPYQRSPVSPPPHGGHVIRGGMELHNCNPSADAGSSNGSNNGLPMHVSYQHHHHQINHHRTSPTKKSPISSDNHMQMANHDLHTVQQPITANNRKKIPNRSSYETHVFMNAPAASVNNPSTSSQQPQKRKNVISKQEMIKVLHLPQTQASSILGCSLSTLKRRFYELKEELEMEKWPQFYHEIRHLPIFSKVYPMSLYFMLNHEGCNDMHKPLTRQHLENAHEMYEQCFDENTNHFLLYCKTTSR